ncbi:hypothetical protein JYU34_022815 [Plutella xylostella]|nr:hypothetical protein JYU34_022815 [Plutella xylostella]
MPVINKDSSEKATEITTTTTEAIVKQESTTSVNIEDKTVQEESSSPTPSTSFETIVTSQENNKSDVLQESGSKVDGLANSSAVQESSVISDTKKIHSGPESNKIPDLKPKIDEFKKKVQKVNIDDKELANERNSSWKLISTVKPPKSNELLKDKFKNENNHLSESEENIRNINLEVSKENQGLEVTTKDLGEDIAQFTELCNELAFRYWHSMTENLEKRRSFVLSPYSITSMLAMMFMGARGATSGEMNDILKLDDMVTFNPHFTLKNISDSIETTPEAGVVVSAFVRQLYSDRNKGKILSFYKERAQHFYNGHVEEINFKLISDIIRRRTNLLVKRHSWNRVPEYMKTNSITMQPPLAALSTNVFQVCIIFFSSI